MTKVKETLIKSKPGLHKLFNTSRAVSTIVLHALLGEILFNCKYEKDCIHRYWDTTLRWLINLDIHVKGWRIYFFKPTYMVIGHIFPWWQHIDNYHTFCPNFAISNSISFIGNKSKEKSIFHILNCLTKQSLFTINYTFTSIIVFTFVSQTIQKVLLDNVKVTGKIWQLCAYAIHNSLWKK